MSQVQTTTRTWTQLDANAAAGSSSITLAEDIPGWLVGDEIVVASTDFDDRQSERRTIGSIAGRVINFSPPLNFLHWGSIWRAPNGDFVDERGEVRTILIHFSSSLCEAH